MNNKKNSFMNSLVVVNKSQLKNYRAIGPGRVTFILSCCAVSALYLKGSYLCQHLSCLSLYCVMPARPNKTGLTPSALVKNY